MRINSKIDNTILDSAKRAGRFKTRRQALDAGLVLLARKGAYRELLSLRGKLHWKDAPTTGLAVTRELATPAPRGRNAS